MNENYFPEAGHKVCVQTPFGSRNAFVVAIDGDALEEDHLIEVKIRFEKSQDRENFHDQFERYPRQNFRTIYLCALRNCMISWS